MKRSESNGMEIFKDFSEWLTLLNEHRVEYVIVGGHALSSKFSLPVETSVCPPKKPLVAHIEALA